MKGDEGALSELNILIHHLGPDKDRAWAKYRALHQRLTRFFIWRGISRPQELADKTLDRIAEKLNEGESIRDIEQFSGGVARNIAREEARISKTISIEELVARDLPNSPPEDLAGKAAAVEEERMLTCLDECLARQEPRKRQLALEYYSINGEGDKQKDARIRLAHEYGIKLGALRTRMARLRDQLESCVTNCIGPNALTPISTR